MMGSKSGTWGSRSFGPRGERGSSSELGIWDSEFVVRTST